ncbi:MAG: gas vesicle protein K [Planctomycetota bacterium]
MTRCPTELEPLLSALEDVTAVDDSEADASPRLNVDPADVKKGLGQLVLTVVRLLHELLERQAIRRIESGSLTDDEADRLGTTMKLQAEEIEKLAGYFGLRTEDLNMDLGPLGKLM